MWANSPVSKMTTSNPPPAAHLTQLVLFHRSRCWFCFSKPMKSAWSGVSLKLPEHYKQFFWSLPDVLTIPPLLPCPPLLPPFPLCFRSGAVSAEGVSPESLGHSSRDVSQWLLATVLRSKWPVKNQTLTQKASSAFDRTPKEKDTKSVTQEKRANTESEPDRHRQWVYRLESIWSKRTAVLNIFLCNVQSLVH